jgi:hypothetical protein
MGVVVVGLGEEGLVGGNDRQVGIIGQPQQMRLERRLVLALMTLDLDIEPVAKDSGQGGEARLRLRDLSGTERHVDRAAETAGQRDQAVMMRSQPLDRRDRMPDPPVASAASVTSFIRLP